MKSTPHINTRLGIRRALADRAQELSPGIATCRYCNMPWTVVYHHNTNYGNRGCFPLCELCWQTLTIDERLPYYRELWESWGWDNWDKDRSWEKIEAAVREGK